MTTFHFLLALIASLAVAVDSVDRKPMQTQREARFKKCLRLWLKENPNLTTLFDLDNVHEFCKRLGSRIAATTPSPGFQRDRGIPVCQGKECLRKVIEKACKGKENCQWRTTTEAPAPQINKGKLRPQRIGFGFSLKRITVVKARQMKQELTKSPDEICASKTLRTYPHLAKRFTLGQLVESCRQRRKLKEAIGQTPSVTLTANQRAWGRSLETKVPKKKEGEKPRKTKAKSQRSGQFI